MSDDNIVHFVERKVSTSFVPSPDAFTYTPKNGYKWLQRLCLWTLAKLKCNVIETHQNFTEHRINTDDVMKALQKQQHNLITHYHHEGSRVLIGSEDFARMMNSPALNSDFSFQSRYFYGNERGCDVYGMKITVVPWMEGILVCPKEFK